MTGARFAARVALAAAVLSLMMLAVAVGVGQAQSTTTAPSQLTREYPLGEKKLAAGPGSAAANGPARSSDAGGPGGGSMLWLLLLAPVVVLVLLVSLVAYARSGPPTAYGYALGNEPRRRRRAPASVIRLLTPLFTYNHHRDAYLLRGIGNRVGPVLKLRAADAEPRAPARPAATAARAAAPLGVRGEELPARLVREPAAANGAEPRPAETPAERPKAKPKPAKAKASTTKKPQTKTTKAGRNGKGKKASAAPKATKAKSKAKAAGDSARSAPTGRFKRDEATPRKDKPPTETRK